jgi:hypothetical protein
MTLVAIAYTTNACCMQKHSKGLSDATRALVGAAGITNNSRTIRFRIHRVVQKTHATIIIRDSLAARTGPVLIAARRLGKRQQCHML